MAERYTRWDAVEELLHNPEESSLYLEACMEEDPGDGSLIRAALNDIARARNITHLARKAGMTRKGLYKALSEDGNPSFATMLRITRALGLQVRIGAVPESEDEDGVASQATRNAATGP